MTELQKEAVRKEIVDYMHLLSTRNRVEIDKKSQSLVLTLNKQTDPELRGLLMFVKGITLFFGNKYEEAKAQFDQIFKLELKNDDLVAMAYMGLAFCGRSVGHMDEAVANHTSAIECLDGAGPFKEFLAYCNHQLGEIHTAIHEYETAINYFENAFAAAGTAHQEMVALRYHMGLGGCYLSMKDYAKSKFHLTAALEGQDLPSLIVSRLENDLGVLYLETDDYVKAEGLLTKCLATRESGGLEDAACTSMTALAEVYLKQNRIPEALKLLDRCLQLVDKYKTKWKKVGVLRLMATAHSSTGNYEQAVGYYEQYHTLYSEIKGEQERNIFKFKNQQIEKQKKIISDKHSQLLATFEEIKRLKVNRKSIIFSWITIIMLVLISEMFLDPLIENYAYNNVLSLLVKVGIALMFKPIDGLYEKILWDRTLRKAS